MRKNAFKKSKKYLFLLINQGFFLLFISTSYIQAQPKIKELWPDGIPNSVECLECKEITNEVEGNVRNVKEPQIIAYLPPGDKATGMAIIICPGGGYETLCIGPEGHEIAKQLNLHGIAGIVLKYRLPSDKIMKNKSIGPLQDAQEALRMVRRNALKWNIDPHKVGIMGFSAGGHLASTLSTHFKDTLYNPGDTVTARPDFSILVYPLISFNDSITHIWSRNALLGKTPPEKLIKYYSNDLQVNKDTPPAFIVHSANDKDVPVEHSIRYFKRLQENNVPAELHIYEKGGHGYNLALQGGSESGWFMACMKWLKARGI